jgi:hypothetical protein
VPLGGEPGWLVFHAMPVTSGVMAELGLPKTRRRDG